MADWKAIAAERYPGKIMESAGECYVALANDLIDVALDVRTISVLSPEIGSTEEVIEGHIWRAAQDHGIESLKGSVAFAVGSRALRADIAAQDTKQFDALVRMVDSNNEGKEG
jgi:hypothetical protein